MNHTYWYVVIRQLKTSNSSCLRSIYSINMRNYGRVAAVTFVWIWCALLLSHFSPFYTVAIRCDHNFICAKVSMIQGDCQKNTFSLSICAHLWKTFPFFVCGMYLSFALFESFMARLAFLNTDIHSERTLPKEIFMTLQFCIWLCKVSRHKLKHLLWCKHIMATLK